MLSTLVIFLISPSKRAQIEWEMHGFEISCNLRFGVLLTGLSLKTQELTALFLAVRLYCSFVMEFDIHTVLDSATLVTTLWVIYMIRFKLKASYMEDKDNFAIYYVVSCLPLMLGFSTFLLKNVDLQFISIYGSPKEQLFSCSVYRSFCKISIIRFMSFFCKCGLQVIPCAVLSVLIHPSTHHHIINKISWAFCVYLEAVSVLPQLRVMQNTKVLYFKKLENESLYQLPL